MTDNEKNRTDILEGILLKLHHGAEPESVQEEFNEHFTGVSAMEISMMEHQLIYGDGPITFHDVLKLCNVHANLFKGSIAEGETHDADKPGHPVKVFKEENMALRSALLRINNILTSFKQMDKTELNPAMIQGLRRQFDVLGQFDKHYKRKEHLFFPMMEKYGHDAPPKVMWAKDDEIRDLFRRAYKTMEKFPEIEIEKLIQCYEVFQFEFNEMIFKEEAILINILLEILTPEDWYEIAKHSDYYGYAIVRPTEKWVLETPSNKDDESIDPRKSNDQAEVSIKSNSIPKLMHQQTIETTHSTTIETKKIKVKGGYLTVSFEADNQNKNFANYQLNPATAFTIGDGFLSLEQIKLIFDYIPARVSYFNQDNKLQYYNHKDNHSYSKRKPEDIGQSAKNCYSADVWEKLELIIEDFKTMRSSVESYWFKYNDQYVHLDYKVLLDEKGQYQGFIEIEQNIQPILDITTEKWRNLLPLSKVDRSLKDPADLSVIQNHSHEAVNQLVFNDGSLDFSWLPHETIQTDDVELFGRNTLINIGPGYLSLNQVQMIFDQLPFEITYVDEHHKFKYFNNTGPYDEMLFQRSPIEIGRDLEYCHPARLWPKVQRLSEDLKHQRRFVEPMWFSPMGKLIYILYMGTQDHHDAYRGIVETVQDASIYLDKVSDEKRIIEKP
ncbi:DUF438 domain-containing protein [Aerococcaceae bacterium WGS1372]